MLSILIPTYNYDIRELVKELHTQGINSYKTFEIIVMEDGSTEFLEENSEVQELKFCQYIQLSENIGRSAIRNRLAEKAKYNHLLFLDCDALIPNSNFINRYLSFCKEDKIVLGGRIYTDKKEPQYSLIKKYGKKRERNNSLNQSNRANYPNFTTPNFLIYKQVFEKIKFDENIVGYGHEDTIFGIELKRLGLEYIFIDNPVLHIGIEENEVFIEKSKKAINNLYSLYQSGKYDELKTNSKLLTTFEKIENLKLTSLFKFSFQLFLPLMKKNLCSNNPSLLIFDIYKLLYLCKVAKEK